jgi:hypothetical protein
MGQPTARLVLAGTILAAGCLAAGCAQGSTITTALPTFSASRNLSISPPTASPRTTPAAGGSGVAYPWLWVVLGALVVATVAALTARHFARRSSSADAWRSKVVDACAKGSALYHMIALAEAPGVLAGADASARWADIRRRGDDLIQTLYALRETAPGEVERAQVVDVLTSLQALRTAMEIQHTTGGADPRHGAQVHALMLAFDASLLALRSPGERAL